MPPVKLTVPMINALAKIGKAKTKKQKDELTKELKKISPVKVNLCPHKSLLRSTDRRSVRSFVR